MSYKVNINVISVIKINIRDNVTFAINFRAMMMVTVAYLLQLIISSQITAIGLYHITRIILKTIW